MSASKVREIQLAIGTLTVIELEELRAWLESYTRSAADLLDARIAEDLAAGRLDRAANHALHDDHEK